MCSSDLARSSSSATPACTSPAVWGSRIHATQDRVLLADGLLSSDVPTCEEIPANNFMLLSSKAGVESWSALISRNEATDVVEAGPMATQESSLAVLIQDLLQIPTSL